MTTITSQQVAATRASFPDYTKVYFGDNTVGTANVSGFVVTAVCAGHLDDREGNFMVTNVSFGSENFSMKTLSASDSYARAVVLNDDLYVVLVGKDRMIKSVTLVRNIFAEKKQLIVISGKAAITGKPFEGYKVKEMIAELLSEGGRPVTAVLSKTETAAKAADAEKAAEEFARAAAAKADANRSALLELSKAKGRRDGSKATELLAAPRVSVRIDRSGAILRGVVLVSKDNWTSAPGGTVVFDQDRGEVFTVLKAGGHPSRDRASQATLVSATTENASNQQKSCAVPAAGSIATLDDGESVAVYTEAKGLVTALRNSGLKEFFVRHADGKLVKYVCCGNAVTQSVAKED